MTSADPWFCYMRALIVSQFCGYCVF